MKALILILMLCPTLCLAAVTYTEGPAILLRNNVRQSPDYSTLEACRAAIRTKSVTSGSVTFRCRQDTVATFVPVTPAPVDCVVGPWSQWSGGTWSACVNGQQSRQESRMRDILVMPVGGGAACPALIETRTATQSCGTQDMDNPDNWPQATQTYYARDYNTQVAADMWPYPQTVATYQYESAGGFNGSGAWRVVLTPRGCPNEDNAGYSIGNGSQIPPGTTNTLVYSYKFYLPSALANRIGQGGFWSHINKAVDVYMASGSNDPNGRSDTRQVIAFGRVGSILGFAHMKGGAGIHFFDDGRNVNQDFRLLTDRWVEIKHVLSTTGTFTYIKAPGDAGFRKILERLANDSIPGDGGGPYTYGQYGWTLMKSGGGPASSLFGYLDDICGSSNGDYYKIDDVRVLNGWPAN